MSLINDALKRVRAASSSETPTSEPPSLQSPQPATHNVTSVKGWFVLVTVIFLTVAGIFFVGFAMTHHSVNGGKASSAITPAPIKKPVSPPVVAEVPPVTPAVPEAQPASPPIVKQVAKPVIKPVAKSAPTVHPEVKPKLQGIFYSPTAPAAIVDGKTVRPGDQFLQYHVVEITRLTVTLVGADGKTVKLSMDN